MFSTIIFIFLFLPLSLIIYYLTPKILKNYLLLLISFAFYVAIGMISGVSVSSFIVFIGIIVINYISGICISALKSKTTMRIILTVGVLLNLGCLIYYKYVNFGLEIAKKVFNLSGFVYSVVIPIGLSFLIFKCISYLIDVYRKDISACRNPLYFALYTTIFTQVISGPIERFSSFAPQLKFRKINMDRIVEGLRRFSVGLAKKIILADVIALYSDKIFSASSLGIDAPTAWLGALCYMFQIYFDFSGYTDMAIGIGKLFGFNTPENFNYPYISKSITEFWRRWHISLSGWFRDYLYIPLGGNRRGNVYINLFIVFLATGLWHGAAFAFLFWGMLHGICIIAERFLTKKNLFEAIPSFFRWLYTSLVIMFGWIFFKTGSFIDTISYVKQMFGSAHPEKFTFLYYIDWRLVVLLALAAFASTQITKKICIRLSDNKIFQAVKLIGIILLFALSIVFLVNSSYTPFIYFQF